MFGKKKRNRTRKKRSLAKKILRFFMFTLGGIVVLIVGAAIIIPMFFTDDIVNAVREEVNTQIDAELYLDGDDVDLSLWSNFPNVTLEMNKFGIVGKGEFEGDTLVSADRFKVEIDIWSLFGDKFKINGIYLDRPLIQGLITKDGKANWDIAIAMDSTATEEEIEEAEASEPFSFKIDEWSITEGRLLYDDRQGNTYVEINGLNHSGSGNFEAASTDLITKTEFKKFIVESGGITYFPSNYFNMDLTVGMSEEYSKFDFKENRIQLNEFVTEFSGGIKLNETSTDFSTFVIEAKETAFKNILSLVPGMYSQDFDALKTSGTLAFKTELDGPLSDDRIPALKLNLKVGDGMFQYPDLPSKVSKVNVDLNVANEDGNLDNTVVDLKTFSMLMGSNPINAKAYIEGLTNMNIDANANVKLNLADLASIYPIEGIDLKGIFSLNAVAKGEYNEQGSIPAVTANMGLDKGYVKADGFDKALEDLSFDSKFSMPSMDLTAGKFDLNKFNMVMDEDAFSAEFHVADLEAINFNGNFQGVIDLDKMMAMFPIDGMELGGKFIIEDISTEGNLAAIEEERYSDIPTSGKINIEKLRYFDKLLVPGPVTVESGVFTFTPKDMKLTDVKGMLGKSDYTMSGAINNYMGYLFSSTDTILQGKTTLLSNYFDLDEWMYLYMGGEAPTEAETEAALAAVTSATEEEPLEVYPLPQNIDFKITTSVKKVQYDGAPLSDAVGIVIMKEGAVYLKDMRFIMYGGRFISNGYYSTKNPAKPDYAFDMQIDKLQFKEAYKAFDIAKKFFPQAEKIEGAFSSKFNISGSLAKDYMPNFDDLNMDGIFNIHKAEAKDSKLMGALQKAGVKGTTNDITIENTYVEATIEDGYVKFKPFDFKAGNIPIKIEGKNGLAGDIDYKLGTDLPAGALGSALGGQLSKLGLGGSSTDKIHLDFGVTGTNSDPKVKLLSAGGKDVKGQIEDKVKDTAKQELDKQIDKACDKVKPKADKIRSDAEKEANDIRTKAKIEADGIRATGEKTAKSLRGEGDVSAQKVKDQANAEAQKIEDSAKNPLEKKAKKIAADKVRAEGEKKSNTVKDEFEKKAVDAETKANNSAQTVEDKAEAAAKKIEDTAEKQIQELMKECK